MYDAVAIGEVLIDFIISDTNEMGYPVLSAYPGGAPANYLAVLAKLGKQTAIISKAGADVFGSMLTDTLNDLKIESRGVVCDGNYFTTLAFVTLDEQGDREFSFARKPGADMCLREEEIDFKIIAQSKSVYFGLTSLSAQPIRATVKKSIAYAAAHKKMLVFDPNLRRDLWEDLDRAKEEMLWGIEQADIVKMSEEEAVFLFDKEIEETASILHRDYGVDLIFITLGEKGCYFKNQNASGYAEGLRGITTIDTTGAGDIFTGSAIYQVLQSNRSPSQLGSSELEAVAGFACTSAGLSTTRFGGISSIVTMPEIMAAMGNKK